VSSLFTASLHALNLTHFSAPSQLYTTTKKVVTTTTTTTTYTYTPLPSPATNSVARLVASRPMAATLDPGLIFPSTSNAEAAAPLPTLSSSPSISTPSQPTASSLKIPRSGSSRPKYVQPVPKQLLSDDGILFVQCFDRIPHPNDLPAAMTGVNPFHVVMCGREVGIFCQ
jgi:hypothetical protein